MFKYLRVRECNKHSHEFGAWNPPEIHDHDHEFKKIFDNPFSSSQKSFEKMRKMFYLCSALVENGLPFSFAGFQIPTNLGSLFCFV